MMKTDKAYSYVQYVDGFLLSRVYYFIIADMVGLLSG